MEKMITTVMTGSRADGGEVMTPQPHRMEVEHYNLDDRLPKNIFRWKRLVSIWDVVRQGATSTAVILYLEEIRVRQLEEISLEYDRRAGVPVGSGSVRPKGNYKAAPAAIIIKGALMKRAAPEAGMKSWPKEPDNCSHLPGHCSNPRGNAYKLWWTCLECGQRWEREEPEAPSLKVKTQQRLLSQNSPPPPKAKQLASCRNLPVPPKSAAIEKPVPHEDLDSPAEVYTPRKRVSFQQEPSATSGPANAEAVGQATWQLVQEHGGTAGQFKGHKGSLFEGGIREPGIMHWPNNLKNGVVSSEPCASMDIVPTILDAAGLDISKHYFDGKSLLELAKGKTDNDERTLFWEYLDQTAVRRGKWKLVLKGKLIDAYGPVPEVHLANLEDDISESNNLAEKEPEITKELKTLAENWRAQIEEKWIADYGAPSEEQRLNTQMGLK